MIDFRGPSDALHGDTYNALVRQTASELMEVMFDEPTAPRVAPGSQPSSFASEGFGNTSAPPAVPAVPAASSYAAPSSAASSAYAQPSVNTARNTERPTTLGTNLIPDDRFVGFGNSDYKPAAQRDASTGAAALLGKLQTAATNITGAVVAQLSGNKTDTSRYEGLAASHARGGAATANYSTPGPSTLAATPLRSSNASYAAPTATYTASYTAAAPPRDNTPVTT